MTKIKRLLRYDWPLYFVLLFTNWLPDNVVFIRLRGRLARPFFYKCGKRLGLGRCITIPNSSQIIIGNDVYIAYGCWFSVSEGMEIGDEVVVGPYCVFATSRHTRLNGSFRYGTPFGIKIKIGKGAWIGAHSCILGGSNIGKGSAIACHSTVSKNCEENALYAGSPAVLKKRYED